MRSGELRHLIKIEEPIERKNLGKSFLIFKSNLIIG